MSTPKTLEECYVELDGLMFPDRREWLNLPEIEARAVVHHTMGAWTRNNWGLWTGESELCKWFESKLIKHPDDMSDIIITSYYRHKNNKDIKLEEQLEYYIMYWLDDKQKLARSRKKKLNKIR